MSTNRNMSGNELGLMVCEALGVDPSGITEVVISMNAFEPAYVRLTHHVSEQAGGEIAQAVSRLELKKIDE